MKPKNLNNLNEWLFVECNKCGDRWLTLDIEHSKHCNDTDISGIGKSLYVTDDVKSLIQDKIDELETLHTDLKKRLKENQNDYRSDIISKKTRDLNVKRFVSLCNEKAEAICQLKSLLGDDVE
jgi:hypothetical protein